MTLGLGLSGVPGNGKLGLWSRDKALALSVAAVPPSPPVLCPALSSSDPLSYSNVLRTGEKHPLLDLKELAKRPDSL